MINIFQQVARRGAEPLVGMRWSDSATWGGGTPPSSLSDDVTIPLNTVLIMDVPEMICGKITNYGTLIADKTRTSLHLTLADYEDMSADAAFIVGTPNAPYPAHCTFRATFAGTKANNSRYLMYQGLFDVHGHNRGQVETRLAANASIGATTLTIRPDSNGNYMQLKAGDRIIVSPTTYYQNSSTEEFVLTQDSVGATVYLPSGLAAARYGKVQYVKDVTYGTNALTEMPSPVITVTPTYTGRTSIDTSATVAVLTRNVVFEGVVDTDFTTGEHGLHKMAHAGAKTRERYVEFRNAGQAGQVGKYPLHRHMQSYNMPDGMNSPSDGTYIGDLTDDYTEYCSVWNSVQRAIVIHGTCGTKIRYNICYKIIGMAIFEEDGSEMNNLIEGNIVGRVRSRADGNARQIRKFDAVAAAFWFSNPNNTHRYNRAFDCDAVGIYNAFKKAGEDIPSIGGTGATSGNANLAEVTFHPRELKDENWVLTALSSTTWSVVGSVSGTQPNATLNVPYDSGVIKFILNSTSNPYVPGVSYTFSSVVFYGCVGLSSAVPLNPGTIELKSGDWLGNEVHSCVKGLRTDLSAVDTAGNLGDLAIGRSFSIRPPKLHIQFASIWKCSNDGYTNRVPSNASYDGMTFADCPGHGAIGSANGIFQNALVIGPSLNYETPPSGIPEIYYGVASYHFGLNFIDMLFVNFEANNPYVVDLVSRNDLLDSSGAIDFSDMYLNPKEIGMNRSEGLMFKNAFIGLRQPSRWQEEDNVALYGGRPAGRSSWQVAGALEDYTGIVGPAGWDWTYDDDYFTHGISSGDKVDVFPSGRNGVKVNRKFYGMKVILADLQNTTSNYIRAIDAYRLNDTSSLSTPSVVGLYKCIAPIWVIVNQVKTGTGNGTLSVPVPNQNATYYDVETWTLTATSATNFTVSSNKTGASAALTVGTPYNNGTFTATVTAGGVAFIAGDKFTFDVSVVTNDAFRALGGIGLARAGRYQLDFPQDSPYTVEWRAGLTCAGTDPADSLIYSVPWAGSSTPTIIEGFRVGFRAELAGVPYFQYETPDGTYVRQYTAAASEAALLASVGDQYWLDTTNHRCWLKHRGGYPEAMIFDRWDVNNSLSDEHRLQRLQISIRSDPAMTGTLL